MTRKSPQKIEQNNLSLDDLIPLYALNNAQKSALEKTVKSQGAEIKKLLADKNLTAYSTEGITATLSTAVKTSLNQEKALALFSTVPAFMKINDEYNIIKTIEVIDENALEKATFKEGTFSDDMLLELEKCIDKTETVRLLVSKKKEQ